MLSAHQLPVYAPLPAAFVRGEGAWLIDADGRRYLDGLTGVAVCGLGHAHPAISEALCDQTRTLVHCSNWYEIPLQAELADRLCALSSMDRAFFCNSGAEAVEAAIKTARAHGHARGVDLPGIIVADGSFHGRTLATLSATGNRKIQAGFEPLVQGFYRVPFGDVDAVAQVGQHAPNVVAVLVEPIQGEGGVRVPPVGYLKALRELCDRNGWLLMLDEIQTGMGRTGQWFAHQHEHILPDVMTLAKGLGNGFPIGACLTRGAAAVALKAGMHGSTFGGNPLACRVALTVIDTIERENLVARADALGRRMVDTLRARLGAHSGIRLIRGCGLMIGIELDRPCKDIMTLALTEGLLVNVTADTVVRLLPPLILTDSEADELVNRLLRTMVHFLETSRVVA